MKFEKFLLVDIYTDEPSGLGVSPYIDVYPRYVAGAIWHHLGHSTTVHYVTADEFRSSYWLSRANTYDVVVFVGGITVPGKYLDGNPPDLNELIRWVRLINKPFKIIGGPAARFATGVEGGSIAQVLKRLEYAGFDAIVTGDIDEYIRELILEGPERARTWITRRDYNYTNIYAIKGSRIVRMHRRLGHGLIAEIETYRGCSRWVSGGCSFCIEPLYGKPIHRDIKSIISEVESLYRYGIVDFRVGRQSDFYVVGSKELGETEWPKPNPPKVESLLKGIRTVAPKLRTLHIDNVNPGTISRYPDLSIEITKILVKYHTPGDTAALGLESADPRVAKINNLNVTPQEAIEAVKIINKYGGIRDPDGVPNLLPGINFILGLPGETSETIELNKLFLSDLLEKGLLVRRVNIRKLMTIPGTRVTMLKPRVGEKYFARHRSFIKWVRNKFDTAMLPRVFPKGTLIRSVFIEKWDPPYSLGRPPGSYPPLIKVKGEFPYYDMLDVQVIGISSSRSLLGAPLKSLLKS
jgi:radical SAM superfamily enzyme with C-terminal helix-hairpin-helix motif